MIHKGFPWDRVQASKRLLYAIKPWWARFGERMKIVPIDVPAPPGEQYGAITSTDRDMNLYVDVSFASTSPVEELAGAIEKELQYHVRDAWNRLKWLDEDDYGKYFNLCMDLEINSSIKREQDEVTPDMVRWIIERSQVFNQEMASRWMVEGAPSIMHKSWLPDMLGLPDGLSAEQYCRILQGNDPPPPESTGDGGDEEDLSESPDAAESEGDPSDDQDAPEMEADSDSDSDSDSDRDQDSPGDDEQNSESAEGDSSPSDGDGSEEDNSDSGVSSDGDQEDGSDEGESDSGEGEPSEGDPDDSQGDPSEEQGGDPNDESDEGDPQELDSDDAETDSGEGDPQSGDGESQEGDSDGQPSESPPKTPAEMMKDLKNSDHNLSWWASDKSSIQQSEVEDEESDTQEMSDFDIKEAHKEIAEDVKEGSLGRSFMWGISPGERLMEWAYEERRKHSLDCWSALSKVCTRTFDSVKIKGASDVSYSVRNPNQAQVGPILMGLLDYAPKAYLVQDVSGSMAAFMQNSLDVFKSVLNTIATRYGGEITWFTVDTKIVDSGTMINFNPRVSERFRRGYGGTVLKDVLDSMARGRLRWRGKKFARPDVIIMSTDCLFEWPWLDMKKPPSGVKIIVLSVTEWDTLIERREMPSWLTPGKNFIYVDE